MDAADLTQLYLAIPIGVENGTSVPQLAEALNWDQRKVREGFRELRRQHVDLVTMTRPNGVYILPEDADVGELEHTRNNLHARAMDMLVTVRHLDMMIADRRFRPTLF